jgi:hypothetical protein
MQRLSIVSIAVVLALVAFGAAACSSSAKAASTTTRPNKAAFCAANDAIDKAGANVTSEAGFLAVLKGHAGALKAMDKNAPSGAVGQEAREIVRAADTAVASNNINSLNSAPSSGDVDTYCGVDGNGNALPAYFATGKGSTFCSTFLPIYQAVGNASNEAGVLAALVAHKAQISELASEVSALPSSIKANAMSTVEKAQTALTTNSVAGLKQNGNGPASSVALYCGQNE